MSTIIDHGSGVITFALRPEEDWASTTQPHALIFVDWGADHDPNTITFGGPLARTALTHGPLPALEHARRIGDDATVHAASRRAWSPDELITLEHAFTAAIEAIPA